MDRVIMPALITHEFAEAIAKNPEMLEAIMEHQPGEEVLVGQNCTFDCSGNPANIKLVLCNVTISLNENEDKNDKGYGQEEKMEFVEEADGLDQLRREVAVLEAKTAELEKTLKLIPRLSCNRELVSRCKLEMEEIQRNLSEKKKKLDLSW